MPHPSQAISNPNFNSRLPHRPHPRKEDGIRNVNSYILSRLPMLSEDRKNKFLASDITAAPFDVYPGVRNDRIELVATVNVLDALADDLIEIRDGKVTETGDGSDNNAKVAEALGDAWNEAFSRLTSSTDEATQRLGRRIMGSVDGWKKAMSDRYQKAAVMETLDLERYLGHKEYDSGAFVGLETCIWGGDIDAPEHIPRDADLRALLKKTAHHIILVNDLYSYGKEKKEAQPAGEEACPANATIPYNAVAILMKKKNLVVDEAMGEIKNWLEKIEEEMLELRDSLMKKYAGDASETAAVESMTLALLELAGGTWKWASTCGRYQNS